MHNNKYIFILCFVFAFFISGCASQVEFEPLEPQYKLAPPKDSVLAEYVESHKKPELTGVKTLADGLDAFIARLAMIESATTSIDLQYYIYRNDDVGKMLTLFLYQAAERGVRVRILLDDMTTASYDDGWMVIANHPNISVRLFNPSYERHYRGIAFITNFTRMNHRMHNKSLTIDNLVSIVGGRNIGAEYFSANEDVEFGDLDVLTIGEAVDDVSTQFDTYWNSKQVQSIQQLVPANDINTNLELLIQEAANYKATLASSEYYKRLENSSLLERLKNQSVQWYWGKADVVYDPPNKLKASSDTPILLDDLNYFFNQTQQRLVIVSPYFVPGDAATNAFIKGVKQGKDITIVTNSLAATDVLAVHAGYQQYRQKLVEGGVKIYEVKGSPTEKKSSWKGSSRSSLHAKTFVIDEDMVFVGSFNFDPRSALINTEMGIVIESQQLAKDMVAGLTESAVSKAYELAIEDGDLVWIDNTDGKVIYAEPGAGFWRKFFADFLALLPIESQL
ncbi:phospholipase [Shewanella sp. 10N.286.51.B7]|uniref:phospholipase D-like domain-containing protein n=1 Tax=Shewanella sp. 10N.286.51.B7 TaxID=1880836 RepID=UPI000C83A984|nr:phospholipase D family protein [Shewanella sp. 10N.286.51.B7]PMG79181.1 phospholipase [Shewanella sp. 10N.286.51.B7]